MRVRARVVAGGAVLGGVMLVGLALVGGTGDAPGGPGVVEVERLGPATAIQPELREALLTDHDLAPVDRRGHGAGDLPPAGRPTGPAAGGEAPPPARAPATEAGALTELCRALLEDPAGLAELWRAHSDETSSSWTERPGGAILHQLIGVFEGSRAAEAYQRLRESTGGCHGFETTFLDGAPVTVLLEELTGLPAGSVTADDSYSMVISAADGSRSGWLTVDRVGPIVSVLHNLGPAGTGAGSEAGEAYEDLAPVRTAALDKLRPLLRTLHEGAG